MRITLLSGNAKYLVMHTTIRRHAAASKAVAADFCVNCSLRPGRETAVSRHSSPMRRDSFAALVESYCSACFAEQTPPHAVELARILGVSHTTLNHWIREAFGMTPGELIRARQIQRAKFLLETTGLAVSGVARHCGYQSDEGFSRSFVRLVGVPPGAWRRKRLKNRQ